MNKRLAYTPSIRRHHNDTPLIVNLKQILPIENKMKNPSHFPTILNLGMLIVSSLYLSLGIIGYISYGSSLCGSITLNLPHGDAWVLCIQYSYYVYWLEQRRCDIVCCWMRHNKYSSLCAVRPDNKNISFPESTLFEIHLIDWTM